MLSWPNERSSRPEKFGAQIVVPAEAIALDPGDGYHTVRIDDGTSIAAVAVLIATGARYRKLAVPDSKRSKG